MARVDIRLNGTEDDLKIILKLFWLMQKHGLVEILEESKPYPNREPSKLFRIYLKVEVNHPDLTE